MKKIGRRRNDWEALSSTVMASLGNGDVSERMNVGYFLDRGAGRGILGIVWSSPQLETLQFL
jgi:hypothetical protein